jgi:hypothetical protein
LFRREYSSAYYNDFKEIIKLIDMVHEITEPNQPENMATQPETALLDIA